MNARDPLRIQMHFTTFPILIPSAMRLGWHTRTHTTQRHTHTHTHTHSTQTHTLVFEVEPLGGRPPPFLRGCMMMGSDAVSDIVNLGMDSRTFTHTHGK